MKGAWIALMLLVAYASLAQPPKSQGATNSGPTIKSQAHGKTNSGANPAKQTPLPVIIIQSDNDAAHGAARETKADQDESKYLDTQRRMAEAAETQLGIAHFVVIVAAADTIVALLALWFLRKTYQETKNAAKAATSQARTARDDFNTVHRPRLIVRRETLRENPKDSGINFVLMNKGGLGASRITAQIIIEVCKTRDAFTKLREESLPPYGEHIIDICDLIRTEVLQGGQRRFIYIPSDQLQPDVLDAIKSGTNLLVFFGLLNFYGPENAQFTSAFFRWYDYGSKTFTASEDPDYEYD